MLIFGIRVEYEKWTSVFLMRSVKTIKRKYFIKKEKKKKYSCKGSGCQERIIIWPRYEFITQRYQSFFQDVLNEEGVLRPEDTVAVVTTSDTCGFLVLLV